MHEKPQGGQIGNHININIDLIFKYSISSYVHFRVMKWKCTKGFTPERFFFDVFYHQAVVLSDVFISHTVAVFALQGGGPNKQRGRPLKFTLGSDEGECETRSWSIRYVRKLAKGYVCMTHVLFFNVFFPPYVHLRNITIQISQQVAWFSNSISLSKIRNSQVIPEAAHVWVSLFHGCLQLSYL